jgi:hypothetical protein
MVFPKEFTVQHFGAIGFGHGERVGVVLTAASAIGPIGEVFHWYSSALNGLSAHAGGSS